MYISGIGSAYDDEINAVAWRIVRPPRPRTTATATEPEVTRAGDDPVGICPNALPKHRAHSAEEACSRPVGVCSHNSPQSPRAAMIARRVLAWISVLMHLMVPFRLPMTASSPDLLVLSVTDARTAVGGIGDGLGGCGWWSPPGGGGIRDVLPDLGTDGTQVEHPTSNPLRQIGGVGDELRERYVGRG